MLRLLAVHAHPDDESSKGAGTMARYRAAGAHVTVVSCTGGEAGSVLNDRLESRVRAERDLTGFRRGEMRRAQHALGIDHVWLGYVDSGLPDEGEPLRPLSFATMPLEIASRPLARVIRRVRPHVVVTYDEQGGYPHPDHIRCHEVTMAALERAAAQDEPALGEPWEVQKLYFDRIMSVPRAEALLADFEAHDPESPRVEQLRQWAGWMRERGKRDEVTTRIDIAEHLDARDAALRSHASQVSPDSPFFFWPHDVVRRAWPTEDFQLVRSTVASELPETDLFAGVREDD